MQNYPVGKEFSLKWKHQYQKIKTKWASPFLLVGVSFCMQKIMKLVYANACFIIFIFNTLSIQ